jgi:hypothetical protein
MYDLQVIAIAVLAFGAVSLGAFAIMREIKTRRAMNKNVEEPIREAQ